MIFIHREHHTMTRAIQRLLLSGILLASVLLAVSEAQITLDGSLGPRGPLMGPHYQIGAELGQLRGSNLFHSFEQFNVPTGGSATFTGPGSIAHIIGRGYRGPVLHHRWGAAVGHPGGESLSAQSQRVAGWP
jgi:large exoprotein involved in heme utilization and adhesion